MNTQQFQTPQKLRKKIKKPASIEETTGIDTTLFEYAKSVEVTNARDITKHITLKINLNDGAEVGLGTLYVLNQTYDSLEQDDIVGIETITI